MWSMEAIATVYFLTLSETHTYAHVYTQVRYRATTCKLVRTQETALKAFK